MKEKKEYALDDNGERIPLIDQATGQQKVDSRNRKQWKRITVQDNTWNSKEYVEQWRSSWAECCNARLAERDHIDHRSYARQGIEQIPTIHEGYAARQMTAKGKISERISINEEIRQRNSLIQTIAEQLKAVGEQIKQLTEQIKEKGSVMNIQMADCIDFHLDCFQKDHDLQNSCSNKS